MLSLICILLFLYTIALFATIILSWFPIEPGTPMAQVSTFLWRITDPVLGPVRRAIPAIRLGGFSLDISPILVFLAIRVLQSIIC